jgi:hypothetical protein
MWLTRSCISREKFRKVGCDASSSLIDGISWKNSEYSTAYRHRAGRVGLTTLSGISPLATRRDGNWAILIFPAKWRDMGVNATVFLGELVVSTTPMPLETPLSVGGYDPALLEGLNYHQLVHRLVAISLGLDLSDCQSRGLWLMLAYNRCIGLMAPDIVGGGTLLEGSHDSLYGGRDVISISTTGLHNEPDHYRRENKGELMLEAVEIVDEPLPR